jgi:hypothetical protein
MRRASLLVAVAVLVAGLAVMVPGWLLDDRDYLAVTPQPPPVEGPTELELTPGGRLCMNSVALDEHSDEARIFPVDGRAVPVAITVRGEDGYVATGRAGAGYRPGDVVALPVKAPPRSLIATVCLHSGGDERLFLAAVVDRRRSRSAVFQDGVAVQPGFAIQFAEREPVSILERLPASLRRMSVLRPVSDAVLWPLLVVFVAGIPVLAWWAFARALRHDGA